MILHDLPSLEVSLRGRFPDRRVYRLVLVSGPPFAALVPLGGPAEGPTLF